MKKHDRVAWDTVAHEISLEIYMVRNREDFGSVSNYMFVHTVDFYPVWASRFMEHLVLALIDEQWFVDDLMKQRILQLWPKFSVEAIEHKAYKKKKN